MNGDWSFLIEMNHEWRLKGFSWERLRNHSDFIWKLFSSFSSHVRWDFLEIFFHCRFKSSMKSEFRELNEQLDCIQGWSLIIESRRSLCCTFKRSPDQLCQFYFHSPSIYSLLFFIFVCHHIELIFSDSLDARSPRTLIDDGLKRRTRLFTDGKAEKVVHKLY